ncbi:MAG: 23S rRNA (pseudouridine(1915)-N(3))-methyltransferase RlmH [Helicobacteraceae bacterium]|jgi:23S rRNA (pseudouridine1915-N3)-methyltransferase|nr:23S rRNA (pseudouridine(1915)-N(3))-methyltransferase RlmH [Helicobacteraceae bacterium]
MTIEIRYIGKDNGAQFSQAQTRYAKLIAPYAKLSVTPVWNGAIEKAQKIGFAAAQEAYARAFSPRSGYAIALSAEGKSFDSAGFAALIASRASFCFYIGGAYGLDRSFCESCDLCVSLSPLTFSHDLARIVLLEQLYRAFAINARHPYDK